MMYYDHHVVAWLQWLHDTDRARYIKIVTTHLASLVDGRFVRVRRV
jgi:hypothetical protein